MWRELFAGDPFSPSAFASKSQLPCCFGRPSPCSMAKRARNPDVPEISEATRLAFKSELAEKLQSKAESKAKRLGWGARLEAAAQAGAGAELESIAASEQKPPKDKKSKHKKRYNKKKKSRHTSSDSDNSLEKPKRSKEKKQKTKRHKHRRQRSISSDSDSEDQCHSQPRSKHGSRSEDSHNINNHPSSLLMPAQEANGQMLP